MEGACRGYGATPSGAGMNALVASARCRWFRAAQECSMPSQIDMGGERAREDRGLLTVVVEERVVLIHATPFVSKFKHRSGFSQPRAQHFLGSIFNTFHPPRSLPPSPSFTALLSSHALTLWRKWDIYLCPYLSIWIYKSVYTGISLEQLLLFFIHKPLIGSGSVLAPSCSFVEFLSHRSL